MSESIVPRRTHPAALASFLLGLASLALCMLILTGLPAMWLGLRGVRAVNASEGRLRGVHLAVAGMILGGIGTAITLLGLCVILVLQMSEKSNRVESANNLRQIGVALNKYADTLGRFPAATRDPRRLEPDHRLSWMTEVLPLLGEGSRQGQRYQELAKKIDRTKGWDDPANAAALTVPLRVFLCRGHPDFEPNRSPGLTHYVGVAGIDPRAAYLLREDPRAGMFGHDQGVRRRDVARGISETMMVLETTADNGPWLAGGHPTVRGLAPDEKQYSGPGRPFGGMHSGLNVLWVDGSVRLLSDKTPAELFRAQALLNPPEEAPRK